MLVTWTLLRTPRPQPSVPWQPPGALWWQAGRSAPGRAEPPDLRWWAVLTTWPDRASHRLAAASGFLRCADLAGRGPLGDRPDPLAGRTGAVVREPASAAP